MNADSGTPKTDAVFDLIALSNHSECDIEHHRQFLEEARAEIVRMEREAAELRADRDALAVALRAVIHAPAGKLMDHYLMARQALAAHAGKP